MAERFTTRIAVFVVVRNNKGEVLLEQRGPDSYLGGYWDLPSGHGEMGESIRDTAIRELKEEMDVIGRPEDLRLIHIDQYFVEVNYINFVFELVSWGGTPKICEPDKCSAIGWYAQDALPEQCVNVVQMVAAVNFSSELTYSVTDAHAYYEVMGLQKQKP
jgi:mutator protein MutT